MGNGRRARLIDIAGAAFVTVLVVLGSLGESYPANPTHALPPGAHPPPWPAYLLVAGAGVALVWRRRWPLPVWAFTVATVTAYSMLGYVYGAGLIAPTVAVYTLSALRGVRRSVLLGLVTTAVLVIPGGLFGPFHSVGGVSSVVAFEMTAAVCLGLAVANRRAYIAEIQDRAERAERTREEEARRRVDVERLRIARELHDVVAHTMATISVQAAAATHVLVDPPPVAAEALKAIRAASKDGLRELRTILNVLRQADEADPTEPAPGLAQLDVLVATSCRAGLPTTIQLAGPLPPLPSAVDLAAYRIIQESLTNTLRHAGPATATVDLAVTGVQLSIDVVDTGRGASPGASGHGLAGMRERAVSIGGTLEFGPAPGGGFLVQARLPVDGSTS